MMRSNELEVARASPALPSRKTSTVQPICASAALISKASGTSSSRRRTLAPIARSLGYRDSVAPRSMESTAMSVPSPQRIGAQSLPGKRTVVRGESITSHRVSQADQIRIGVDVT